MKLPYITVEYREENTGAPGKMSPALIFGFGLHWAWMYLFMFNGHYLLFPAAASMQTVLSGVSGGVFAVTLLLYAVFLPQARALFATPRAIKRNRLIAACLVLFSMLLCLVAGMLPASGFTAGCFAAAGAGSGIGSAVLLMSFGVSFSVCDLPTIATCTALSLVVSAVMFSLGFLFNSIVASSGALMCLLLPPFELLCLNKCSSDLVDKLEFTAMTMPVRTASFAAHLGIPSVVFGFLLGALRMFSLVTLPSAFETSVFDLAILAASAFTCATLVIAMLTLRKSRNFTFRVFVPLIAMLLTCLCTEVGGNGFFWSFALISCYFMLEACMWVMYADISQNYRVSAFTTFGFGHGLLAAGSLVGFLLIQPGMPLDMNVIGASGLATIALVALTLGTAVLPNSAEMRSTLERGRSCPSFLEDTDIEEIIANAEQKAENGPHASDASASEPRSQKALAESIPTSSEPGTPAAPPQPPTARRIPTSAGDGAPHETPAQTAGRFKRKCAAVADTFLLSRKETEVLFLLAKGRNSATIQETLYISPGTANTHMRHIYRKLDVHSQHELIELVESMHVDDEPLG